MGCMGNPHACRYGHAVSSQCRSASIAGPAVAPPGYANGTKWDNMGVKKIIGYCVDCTSPIKRHERKFVYQSRFGGNYYICRPCNLKKKYLEIRPNRIPDLVLDKIGMVWYIIIQHHYPEVKLGAFLSV